LATLAEMRATVPELQVTDVGRLTRDIAALASVIPGHTWTATEIAEGSVPMDRALITQAWLQLADNAAKYAPAGTPIEIGSRIADGSLRLWVRDYGPGIMPGQERRIFERFARSTDGTARGSGLGLAIVEGIAHAHGGSARVESPGTGSRFVIAIPMEEVA
jgi:two-component system OmpR family sensor kinase